MVKVLVITDPKEIKEDYPGYDGVFIQYTDPAKRKMVWVSWLTEGLQGREQVRAFDDEANMDEEIKKGFFVNRETGWVPIDEVVRG